MRKSKGRPLRRQRIGRERKPAVMTGEQFVRVRVETLNISQRALAIRMGTTERTIWNYEHDLAPITDEVKRRLAQVVGGPALVAS